MNAELCDHTTVVRRIHDAVRWCVHCMSTLHDGEWRAPKVNDYRKNPKSSFRVKSKGESDDDI